MTILTRSDTPQPRACFDTRNIAYPHTLQNLYCAITNLNAVEDTPPHEALRFTDESAKRIGSFGVKSDRPPRVNVIGNRHAIMKLIAAMVDAEDYTLIYVMPASNIHN